MNYETVKALLQIVKVCAAQISCASCPLRELCEKKIVDW